MRKAYAGMICGQSVDFEVQGVSINKQQVRAIRLTQFSELDNTWAAVVKTGKHRGQTTTIATSDIIVFKDRDGVA